MKHNIVTFTAITVFALSGIIFWETGLVLIVFAMIVLLYLGLTAYGSFHIQTNYFLRSINYGKRNAIALTFDDGPDPDTTPKILQILKEKDIKAAFFVIGKKAEKYPELLRQMDKEGHIVANHTFNHHYFTAFFSTQKLKAELLKCNAVIADILGKKPLFFRPPFGVTNPRYATALKELGLNSIGWSLRSLDTKAENKYQIINKIISEVETGHIILLHDNRSVTADSLEDVIEHCRQKGIRIESLSKLIQKEPYENG
ncbi:polysaccharide deacetylase family protein [Dyadobacter sediminis]|uniref:Polysaccharide deacetylase family protein n=1 Tax=Dyadobacter sediminis TaxID=1493691 RepID=A0A5R9KL96_9BACT|nr:polysaccharide deacetylase family protein [Dyadobacter sediminis]TLU96826.1 polysaccharide deacetylase family protein [Dyadobacter sediminis]GGB85463.1 polysaccharide deacetylase [Dyadobacter sediminis]